MSQQSRGFLMALALSFLLAATGPALAGYMANGYDLGLVKSDSGLANAKAIVQTKPLFNGSYATDGTITTTFTSATYQNIAYARLYLDVYGGTPYYSANWTASLNGQSLPTLAIGGTGVPSPGLPGDANPSNRNPNTTCVYGSGYGYWEIAYADIASKLKHDGTDNTLAFSAVATDSGQKFDSRQYGATLVVVYTDPAIQQTLDYQLFEGDGYMRKTAGATAPGVAINLDRDLSITGVNTTDVISATYTAGYATGHNGQTDQIYFNGTALGPTAGLGNDIARVDSNTELHSFDVTAYLQGSNSVLYSIDQSVLGGTGESSLHADWTLLTVTHPVPEPATLGLLMLGAAAVLRRRTVKG